MIIRTYTDDGKLTNEHKLSDENNYAEFYNMIYINILRRVDKKHVIKLCVDLLRRTNVNSELIGIIEQKQIDPIIGEYVDKNFWDLLD